MRYCCTKYATSEGLYLLYSIRAEEAECRNMPHSSDVYRKRKFGNIGFFKL